MMSEVNVKDEPFVQKVLESVRYIFYFELIGIVYSIVFFAGFGLNFADFANISDLLLSSFKEPLVFLLACVVVLTLIAKPLSFRTPAKTLGLMLIPIVAAVLMAALGIHLIKSEGLRMPFSNTGTTVRIHLAAGSSYQKINSARFIGHTGSYFFFYDVHANCTLGNMMIVPSKEIVRIERERVLSDHGSKEEAVQNSDKEKKECVEFWN